MKFTKKQILEAEQRAAEIFLSPLRPEWQQGPLDMVTTTDEFCGWCMHYWYQYSRSKKERARAPATVGELAGWLAREMYIVIDD